MATETTRSSVIRSIIIDDDPFIHDLLRDKLQQFFPEIEVLAVCGSGQEGMQQICRIDPDLVFLDVEMADMTGFEMLTAIDEIRFKTIFITSHNHYAIKAIRFNALDYLLKPFDLEELRNAIRRFKQDRLSDISPALKNFKAQNAADQSLVLRTQQGDLQLPLQEIIRIEGDRNYSSIHLTGERKELVSKTLSNLEELLEDKGFFRCHKSHIVNRMHIAAMPKRDLVLLTNNKTVRVSRRKEREFKAWVNLSEQ